MHMIRSFHMHMIRIYPTTIILLCSIYTPKSFFAYQYHKFLFLLMGSNAVANPEVTNAEAQWREQNKTPVTKQGFGGFPYKPRGDWFCFAVNKT